MSMHGCVSETGLTSSCTAKVKFADEITIDGKRVIHVDIPAVTIQTRAMPKP